MMNEITVNDPNEPLRLVQLPHTPMTMLDVAIRQGAGMDVLEKLMALQERWEKNQGRKAFDNAIALAKADIPVIFKNRQVDFTSQKGRTHYRHEDLAGIAMVVDPILSQHGLSYRFRTAQDGARVTVTCIISHREGHSEENSLSASNDISGNKNDIQAVGSTVTYLERYTLKAALGLSVSNDDDARTAGSSGAGDTIAQDQIADLQAMIESIGGDKAEGLKKGFLKKFKIESLADLPVSEWKNAVAALQAKRAA